jgi:hypothetical protein
VVGNVCRKSAGLLLDELSSFTPCQRSENKMRLDPNGLAVAVRTALSLGAVAALGVAGSTHAQEQAAPQSNQQQL